MAAKDNVRNVTLVSAEALTRGRYISIDSAGLAAEAGAAVAADGIAGSTVLIGRDVDVELLDGSITDVEAGAAVSRGDEIATNATGQGVTAVATNPVNGVALEAAGAAGEIIRVMSSRVGTVA